MNTVARHDGYEQIVEITTGQVTIEGALRLPSGARGIVLFAHGSGSRRHSPRNRRVAAILRQAGLATLMIDLLSAQEEAIDVRTGQLRFDIGLLTERLLATTDWLGRQPVIHQLRLGYFGASTGAGAVLAAAAERPKAIGAVVSRGGRPDLASAFLSRVTAPTLLIVGGHDEPVISLNRWALAQMHGETLLEIVPGATHLFQEPGTLDTVAHLACDWFLRCLSGAADNERRLHPPTFADQAESELR